MTLSMVLLDGLVWVTEGRLIGKKELHGDSRSRPSSAADILFRMRVVVLAIASKKEISRKGAKS